MLTTFLAASRDRKRLQEILAVLARMGLGTLVQRLGLGALPRGLGGAAAPDMPMPERTRRALESLGPVFVKLGQILSTRGDLLPPDWTSALERLQADVPPVSWETIGPRIAEDLGADPMEVFAQFDRTPLAAGSIAQVHRARLKDGTLVVVKALRPGIKRTIDADLRLLAHAAAEVERRSPEIARFRPREIVRHLAGALREELDLAVEGRNCEALAANFEGDETVVFPEVHWELSTERVLVQGFVEGIRPARDGRIEAAGLDGRLIARRGADAFLRMVLVDGLFHADPHPGNLLAMAGNRVGFIDLGSVGRVGDKRRGQLLRFVRAVVRGDGAALSSVLVDWSLDGDLDLGSLDAATDAFIARHGSGSLDLARAVGDLMAMARECRLTLPSDLVLLFKALATADGVMKRLDPTFDAIDVAKPLVLEAMRGRIAPRALRRRAEGMAIELVGVLEDAPSLVKLLLNRLRRGRLSVDIRLSGTEDATKRIERAAARIAIAIVIAAFALGISPTLMESGPTIREVPAAALAGLAVVIVGVLWLAGDRFLR